MTIDKITLSIRDGVQLELTPSEAKTLRDQLCDLFGPKVWPSYPVFIKEYVPKPYPWITYTTSTGWSTPGSFAGGS